MSAFYSLEDLQAARKGDSDAFDALIRPYRPALLTHCYHLSGSLIEAEDLTQEALLRAWEELHTYSEQGTLRNWLFVIATRLWLDETRRRKQVILLRDGPPADPDTTPVVHPEENWLDPLPDFWLSGGMPSPESYAERREALSLAFVVALQKLNARQRAVTLLRDVFQWSAEETAAALALPAGTVNNLLYRARKALGEVGHAARPVPAAVLNDFVRAWEVGDSDGLVALLHPQATFAMPPMQAWYRGREDIRRALRHFVFVTGVRWFLQPASVNGVPGWGVYRQPEAARRARVFGLLIPEYAPSGDGIDALTAYLSPHWGRAAGLPAALT
ncbi:MAG: hypothetical protein Fur0018_02670 [Anaerolineales bacterium]